MQNQFRYVIGLMSGTSLDGVDLVYVKFDKNNDKNFKIIEAKTVVYSAEWADRLKTAINLSKESLLVLDIEYGNYLGSIINSFIKTNKIEILDFIASHGHTVLHEPDKGITFQVGNGRQIANKTGYKTICDFRSQDVALGGQGAPLVPIGDELLFSDYDYCLNLGGFANVSFKYKKNRIAFDICPVNIVMNNYIQNIGLPYDDKGALAATGKINEELLRLLNDLEFYEEKPPKSLGLEWVREKVFPLINNLETNLPNILRTFVEHCAIQIAAIINDNKTILVTGGGTFNTFLIDKIKEKVGSQIKLPNNQLVNFKEALIFAFLGVLKEENRVNCLKSVTGAKKDHSSGVIFYPEIL